MTPDTALQVVVEGLNRAAWNPIEQIGLNHAVETLRKLIEATKPPSPQESGETEKTP